MEKSATPCKRGGVHEVGQVQGGARSEARLQAVDEGEHRLSHKW